MIKNAELKFLIPRVKTEKGGKEKVQKSATVMVCSGFVAAVIVFHRNSSKAARAFFLLKSSQEKPDMLIRGFN